VAVEVYANQPLGTVTSGGTDAPAAGTTETWTVLPAAAFAAASSTAYPPTQFHIADVAAPSETMRVMNVGGNTWTVVRGTESTTPVTHAPGFQVTQVVTQGGLTALTTAALGGPQDWFNVKTYGATGNGSTDDTAAIQAAITAAQTAGGGTVYLPHGKYSVSSTLTITASGLAIIGEPTEDVGSGSMINPTNLSFTVLQSTSPWLVLRDFTIKWNTLTGASGGASGPIGISVADDTQMSNVQVIHAYNGILVQGGGNVFWDVAVELANVADTGRWGICISGASGNPNSFNAYNTNVSTDLNYVGDGWVVCDGFSSIVLNNCYAAGARYGLWATQNGGPVLTGGTTPHGIVLNQWACEQCDTALKLDYGSSLQINGCQMDSMQSVTGGVEVASTWSSGCWIQINAFKYGPGQGGINIAAPSGAVMLTNVLMSGITQQAALEVTGGCNVTVSNFYANMSGNAPAGSGVVQLDSGFTGTFSMSAFTLLNGVYGLLVAAGATGVYNISSGSIAGMSAAPLSIGAAAAGSSITGVSGINTTGPYSTTNLAGIFGDGSDGAAVLNGTNTYSWASLAGSTYTLSRDIFVTSLTISGGVTVNTAAFRTFCAGPIASAGTIQDNGNTPPGTTTAGAYNGAAGTTSHTYQNGAGGGAGAITGTAGNGSQGAAIGGVGSGGAGGAGTTGTAGSGGSTRGGSGTFNLRIPQNAISGALWAATTDNATAPSGGSGGGGGAGDGTNSGGAGGGGGGVIAMFAWSVINTGTISAAGGAGSAPTAGNCGGGGGGGGGLILAYTLSPWTAGTTSVAGGAGGGHTGTGVSGSNGNNGSVLNVIVQ
jgi:hypothetical protein